MVTRNMEAVIKWMLQNNSLGTDVGMFPARNVSGVTRFISNWAQNSNGGAFPAIHSIGYATNPNNAGISFGTGGTAATKDDYNLESTITSGLNVLITKSESFVESSGNPVLRLYFSITNTGSETVTIREIGYKQILRSSLKPGTQYDINNGHVFLLDRTVLENPLVLEPTDAGALVYTLKTATQIKTKNNIELVDFAYGTDEQIAAMIDAAHDGLIDLHSDGGWQIGSMRKIHISSFTGGNETVVPEQDLNIMISSFDEFGESGNVLQFDFVEGFSVKQRMHSSNSNAGGYSTSEMNTVTIPAIIAALPTWIKNRLLPFKLKCLAGNNSSSIETIQGIKMALRSVDEIRQSPNVGEGEYSAYQERWANRIQGINGDASTANTWTRTPSGTANYIRKQYMGGYITDQSATSENVCAPFGCL